MKDRLTMQVVLPVTYYPYTLGLVELLIVRLYVIQRNAGVLLNLLILLILFAAVV